MNGNDIEAVMKLYAADAVTWFPGGPESRGTQAIRAGYEGLMSGNTVKDASISNAVYRTVGKSSVAWGNFSFTLVPKAGGNPTTLKGRYTEVAEKRNGRWVLIVDHASADPPPAAK